MNIYFERQIPSEGFKLTGLSALLVGVAESNFYRFKKSTTPLNESEIAQVKSLIKKLSMGHNIECESVDIQRITITIPTDRNTEGMTWEIRGIQKSISYEYLSTTNAETFICIHPVTQEIIHLVKQTSVQSFRAKEV